MTLSLKPFSDIAWDMAWNVMSKTAIYKIQISIYIFFLICFNGDALKKNELSKNVYMYKFLG